MSCGDNKKESSPKESGSKKESREESTHNFTCEDLDSLLMSYDTTSVAELLSTGCEFNVDFDSPDAGLSLLHESCKLGDLEKVRFLLDHGFDPNVHAVAFMGGPMPITVYPLDYAFKEGHLETAALLIQRGATDFRVTSVPMTKRAVELALSSGIDINKTDLIWAEEHTYLIESPHDGDPYASTNLLGLAYLGEASELVNYLKRQGAELIQKPIFKRYQEMCETVEANPDAVHDMDLSVFDKIERPGGYEWIVSEIVSNSETMVVMKVFSIEDGDETHYELSVSNYGNIQLKEL